MDKKRRKGITKKQGELMKRHARCLRDKIVAVITQWVLEFDSQADIKEQSESVNAAIRDEILREAYAGLVWRTLDRAERYNTPYYQRLLEKLRSEHPDIKVKNKLHTFVSWPALRKKDIEAAFSASIKTMLDEKEHN